MGDGEMRFVEGRGWFSRGYLPHFDRRYVKQMITFRLADSLPQAKLERLDEELKSLGVSERDLEKRRRIEEWMDAGHGSCLLREPQNARIVEQAFFHFDGQRYRLLAWVVMPNHVHVLIEVIGTTSLEQIICSWKVYTAKQILGAHMSTCALPFAQGEMALNDERSACGHARSQGLWQKDYWDRFIRDGNHYAKAVEYTHYNPVKAGLCATPADWPSSSARYLPPSSGVSHD